MLSRHGLRIVPARVPAAISASLSATWHAVPVYGVPAPHHTPHSLLAHARARATSSNARTRTPLLSVLVAAVVLAVAPARASADADMPIGLPGLSDADYQTLLSGEPIRVVERGAVHSGEVVGMIQAPVDELAAIILDYENLGEWSPAAYDVHIIQRSDSDMVVEGKTALPWPITDRTWHNRAMF